LGEIALAMFHGKPAIMLTSQSAPYLLLNMEAAQLWYGAVFFPQALVIFAS
jgi:hypothetical protein